jgi:trk system potassium uptake protein TrkA
MFVLLVGGGKVGSYLGELLIAEGHTIKIIENRLEHVERLRGDLPDETVVPGNGTDPTLLEREGIGQADVVAAVTGRDETNLVVTNLARLEFNVPRTIARVNNPKNAWMFTPQMGVDVRVNQADVMARLIVEEMSLGEMTTLLKLQRGQYSLVEEKVHPQAWVIGKMIGELGLPNECVLTAIIRAGTLIIPHGKVMLQAGDEVLGLVHAAQIDRLKALLGKPA